MRKKKGRDFEEMIARVEQGMAPKGAVVTSPDSIPDKVTGEPREVDASIRYKVGSVPILVIIECRDRKRVQDITWLEQIKSKRDSVGASLMLAVSRSGFSDPAKIYASQHNIELRQIAEVTDETILNSMPRVSAIIEKICWKDATLKCRFYVDKSELGTSINILPSVAEKIVADEPFAKHRNTGPITVKKIFASEFQKIEYEANKSFARDQEFPFDIKAMFSPEELMVDTNIGKKYISEISFQGIAYLEKLPIASLKPIQYQDANGNTIESFSEGGVDDLRLRVTYKEKK